MASTGIRARLSSVSKSLKTRASRKSISTCEMYFTPNHEWVQLRTQNSNIARIGLSDFRAQTSGDYVTIALDQIDISEKVYKGEELCQVDTTTDLLESVKVPITCKVLKVNEILNNISEIAHRSPEQEGWLAEIEISNPNDLDRLMTKQQYETYLETSGRIEAMKH